MGFRKAREYGLIHSHRLPTNKNTMPRGPPFGYQNASNIYGQAKTLVAAPGRAKVAREVIV